jgi:flagellar biosynthesis protein FlhA
VAISESKTLSLGTLGHHVDILVAVGVISILLVMIIPLPPRLLDLLLAFNITLSLVTLLVAIYTQHPLEFSIFPSLLLVLTLFRLSLNVSSTRLILLYGNQGPDAAGEVIRSFGSFVVGGNYVVGIIVFSILVLINFIVITKGAGRIAEVGARFTLDGMPGKQMAIDADLNAGMINEEQARQRRQTIQQEADFYGAMDGASKFVSGDAIAGIIITLVNIIGGIIIGLVQQGLPLQQALQSYTILTVGDGLVSQIPALVVSTAAGIVVTKVSADVNIGDQITSQFLIHPRAIGTAAGILFLMGLIPGLPQFPLLLLAALSGAAAFLTYRGQQHKASASAERPPSTTAAAAPEPAELLAPIDLLELEVGYGLIPLVDAERHGELLERIKAMRRQIAQELGVMVPPLRIRDDLQLKPAAYTILIKGIEVARGELMVGHYLAMHPGNAPDNTFGMPTTEPAFGLPAVWIKEEDKEQAQLAGYTVVDLATVIITHLTEVIKRHIHELLSREEVQKLLNRFAQDYPKVVEELVPSLLPLGVVQKVLQNLLREQLSVRDLLTILETLADYAALTKDPMVLTEYVRHSLARSITKKYQSDAGEIAALMLSFELEANLTKAIQSTEHGSYLALDPALGQRLLAELNKAVETVLTQHLVPILLTSPMLRPHLQRVTEPFVPQLVVLSQNEIAANVRVRNLAVVKV